MSGRAESIGGAARYAVLRRADDTSRARSEVFVPDQRTVAVRCTGNPASPDFALTPPETEGQIRLLWSGTLCADLHAPHPANWMKQGREAARELTQRLGEWAQSGPLLVQPHVRHLISDIPSALAFADAVAALPGVALALAPWSLLERSMLADREEHLQRVFAALGPRAGAFIAEDAAVHDSHDDADTGAVTSALPGAGVLPAGLLRELVGAHLCRDAIVLLPDGGDPSCFVPV